MANDPTMEEPLPPPVDEEPPAPPPAEEPDFPTEPEGADKDDDAVATRLSQLDDAIDEVRAQADEIDERVQLNDNAEMAIRWNAPNYGNWFGGGAGSGFSGICYDRAGNKTVLANLPDRPWIRYNQTTGAFTEEVGPPSEPWGSDELWRKKDDIQGSLYLQ